METGKMLIAARLVYSKGSETSTPEYKQHIQNDTSFEWEREQVEEIMKAFCKDDEMKSVFEQIEKIIDIAKLRGIFFLLRAHITNMEQATKEDHIFSGGIPTCGNSQWITSSLKRHAQIESLK
jgi:hypothetical protein